MKARVYPCPDLSQDQLLQLARQAAALLDPAFDPPREEFSRQHGEAPYDYDETRRRVGAAEQGLEVVDRSELQDRGPATVTVSTVTVRAYGLPKGCALELTRSGDELAVTVEGPEQEARQVVQEVRRELDRPLGKDGLDRFASVAVGALGRQDWPRAADAAQAVLRERPDDVAALFAMSVARGAQGDLVAAHRGLLTVLERDGQNHDAWYNLGNVHRERGELERAAACYRATLEVSPGNHPAFFQLARVLEAAGRRDEALGAYHETVRTSPNPGAV
jgi:tetratricopeptide (TPR) repeat protein